MNKNAAVYCIRKTAVFEKMNLVYSIIPVAYNKLVNILFLTRDNAVDLHNVGRVP